MRAVTSPAAAKRGLMRVRAGRGGMARRAGWGLADQALSSLTNFAIAIVAAHESTPRAFGLFALVFATFSLALGACRAICCEPLSVRYSGASKPDWRVGASMATGTALAVGAIVGLGCMAVGVAIGGQSRDLLVVLGVSLPGLLLQDAWRYAFFAAGSGARAFVNDAVCAFLLLLALAVLLAQGHVAVEGLLALWGASAAVAAIFGIWQSGLMPSPLRFVTWWRRQSDLALRFLAEFVGLTGEYQAMFYAIAAVTGLETVAAVRGGMLLLGPMNILGYGAMIAGVPEAVRLLRGGSRRLLLLSGIVSGGLAVVTLIWAGLILLLPTRLGVSAVGSVWYTARPLIVPLALGLAMLGAVMGAVISLRALAAARRSLRARLVVSPVVLASGLAGAALHGASGAAWGIAVGNSFAAFVFWYHLVRASSEHQAGQPAGKADAAPRMMAGPAVQPS
jgi:hypothetical protein